MPIKGLERAYLAAKSYNGTELIYGNQKRSEKFLPPLRPSVKNLTLETFYSNSDKSNFIEKDSVYDFDRKTSLISTLDLLVIEHNLSGNVIIHSFDSIFVRSTAHLNNVILIAPKIRFESGFKGSVQAIAHKQLIVEKNVFLQYPSVLVLNELETSINSKKSLIQINEKSKVLGGILLVSQFPDVKNPKALSQAQIKDKEGEAILSKLKPTDFVVLLDENGKAFSSVHFANWLSQKQMQHAGAIVFIIGGAYGFSPDVYERAQFKLSLS